MGCYGIGVSRLLAATVEVLSTPEEIRWPLPFAPYLLCVIPPKVQTLAILCTFKAVIITLSRMVA